MTAAWSMQTLARDLKELYMAKSLEDALKTLETETADEQALQLLTQRQREFVPALAALREQAIDSEIFERFREPGTPCGSEDEAGAEELPEANMDAEPEDEKEDSCGSEVQQVGLPDGWRLEWVSQYRGKTKEQYRFVDPEGRKYFSIQEFRAAISGGIEAVEELRRSQREAQQVAKNDRPVVVRTRNSGGHRKKARW